MSDVTIRFKGDASSAVRAGAQTQAAIGGVQGAGHRLARGLAVTGAIVASALVGGLGLAAKASIDFESSFAGVRKTVEATPAQFKQLADGIRDMAQEIPASANELNRIAESAGQLGIKREAILGFTRTVADLGETTNLVGEQAASSLAKIANITGMSQKDFDRLGSTIVALGNAGASTEAEITDMALGIAGAGDIVGLTQAEILGFANALASVGIEAEAGGSAISRVMIDMANAVASGGDELEDFARVAGMSSRDFKRAFEQDAAGAIVTFIEGLGKIEAEGGNVFKVLEDLGLSEIRVRRALLNAAGAGDLFRQSLKLGSKAWKENTALTEEAQKRYETTAAKLEILRNNIVDIGISVGDELVPVLAAAAEDLVGFIDNVREADGIEAKIGIVFAGVGGAVGDVVDSLRDALFGAVERKPLKLKTGKIIEWEVTETSGLVDRFQEAFSRVDWSQVGEAIVDGVVSGLQRGGQLASALAATLFVAIGKIPWEKVGRIVGPGLATALLSAFATILDPAFWIRNWELAIAVAVAALTTVFLPAKFAFLIPRFLRIFLEPLGLALVAILRFLGQLGGAFLRGLVSRVAPNAAAGALRVGQAIIARFRMIPGLAGAYLTQLARIVGERLGQAAAAAGRLALTFVTRYTGPLRTLVAIVARIIGGVVSRIRGFISQFAAAASSIGWAIINGIVGAIRAGAGAIKDAAVSAVKGAIDAAKGVLRIGSPSRLAAEEIGKPIAQGIAAGILGERGAVAAAMEGLVAGRRRLTGGRLSAPASGRIGGLAAAAGGGQVVQLNVNVNGTLIGGGKRMDVARQIAELVRPELVRLSQPMRS